MVYYCKDCLRMYNEKSTTRGKRRGLYDRTILCPIHKTQIFIPFYNQNYFNVYNHEQRLKFTETHQRIVNEYTKTVEGLTYLDIKSLSPEDILNLVAIYDLDVTI